MNGDLFADCESDVLPLLTPPQRRQQRTIASDEMSGREMDEGEKASGNIGKVDKEED